jgi:AP-4 complex subunit epsilon-1
MPPPTVGVAKTKSKEFYDIVRQIGASPARLGLTSRAPEFVVFPDATSARERAPDARVSTPPPRRPPTPGECKNKSDEDVIMRREVMTLRTQMASPKLEKTKMKELLIRLMYVDMLGHDASFGYIHAVKATHESDISMKRLGYLATSAFLDEHHDLIILIVNTVQQDLKTDNYLAVCAALTTVCRLVNEETIPAVLTQVVDLLSHRKEQVRKKAVMALHRFHQRSPSSVAHLHGKFRQMLCDKDPSVMSAALCALHDLILADATPHKNLIPSFVSILKQIVEHRLHNYDYHKVPAPFIQIKLLKILAALGTADKAASTEMYSVLSTCLKRGDSGGNVGNAIVYECVRTAASIYPSPVLLEHCAAAVSRFIASSNHNLKYVGLDSLSCIVNINPKYAAEHQMTVVDCLEDPDESIRGKTLDLLYRMTKSHNVEVVVEKMIEFLKTSTDKHVRESTAARIGELAERYAPTTQWFIDTMNAMFAIGGDVVKPTVAHNLMRLIGEGSGDVGADETLRKSAVNSYLKLLQTPKLPKVLLKVILWVVGEYGTLSGRSPGELQDVLCGVVETQPDGAAVTSQAMTACAKLAAASAPPALSPAATKLIELAASSRDMNKQQRSHEIVALLRESPALISAALPVDRSGEELGVDENLSFMDAFVSKALAEGASPYQPVAERAPPPSAAGIAASGPEPVGALRFDAYDAPQMPARDYGAPPVRVDASRGAYDPYIPREETATAATASEPTLRRKEGTWGADTGFVSTSAPAEPPVKDEKALLADALFSGVTTSSPAAAAAPPPAPPAAADDLFGLGLAAPAPTTSVSSPLDDILSQLSVGGGPAPPAGGGVGLEGFLNAPAPPVSGGFDLLGGGAPAPTIVPQFVGQNAPAPAAPVRTDGMVMSPGMDGVSRPRGKKDPFADLLG